MHHMRRQAIALTVSAALLGADWAHAVEVVGQAALIRTSVTGNGQEMVVRDPVHRDERIRTSRSGLGQFVFRDGTKLAVGWGSSVVIDKFVYDGSNSLKKLTLNAAKGTFRWVSGSSKSTAYEIVTPAGTIGVRGTVFDFYVASDGTTAMVLLNGAASFCSRGDCRQLTRRCDSLVATRSGGISSPRRVNRTTLRQLGNARALPFLTGDQKLTGGMQTGACRLEAALQPKDDRKPPRVREPAPAPPPPPRKRVERPSWDRPDKETTSRDKPDFDRPGRSKPDRDKVSWDRPDRERPQRDVSDRDQPGRTKPDRDRPDRDRSDREQPQRDVSDRDQPDRSRPDRDRPDRDRPDREPTPRDRPDFD
ncbi:FecR family protein [Rhizobium subbaraonis]|uniref:FecR family protein n=1 Tax=Rhizobium subbaraonis TaxID=908946 RepID=A0A285UYI0_9HYPH|nr:FecR domain-containing protein [Rhizobium subbaraonis]SOC45786.1 FecR family protein [Rhizobium subbaraonis]